MAEAGVEIVLPATSANLGPAFDAAALAMRLYIRLQARPSEKFTIHAGGRDASICGRSDDNHLIVRTYREVLSGAGRDCLPLALEIANEIPIGKGCGSSAAARLAGIALANHFGQLGWSEEAIVAEAAAREGHADNCAACWHGGVVLVAGMPPDLQVTKLSLSRTAQWPLLLAIAPQPLPTREARRVLPAVYDRADAVANVQNAMLLTAAFEQGRPELLARALQDRLHQPYRGPLCPLLGALAPLAGDHGIRGVALSGAGPSVLLILDASAPVEGVRRALCARLQQVGLKAELLNTEIETRVPPRVCTGGKR